MSRVAYMVPMQGFRPYTNPGKALAGIGLRGLGTDNTFRGCVSAADAEGNPVLCNDPAATVWMDVNGNAVPAGTPAGAAAQSGDVYKTIQTGSFGVFGALWPWLATAGALLFIRNLGGRRK